MCRPLGELAPHFFTTRVWRLGLSPTLDATNDVRREEAWDDVVRGMEVEPTHLVRGKQVHGATVLAARVPLQPPVAADIVVSNSREIAVAVQAADCVPILIADPRTGAVAAAHAGWRGLSVRVPGAAVAALAREFKSERKDLLAAIGPAIGACCYEVGADVLQRFVRSGFTGEQIACWFLDRPTPTSRNPTLTPLGAPRPDHWYFDAWASAADQLRMSGVPAERIFVAELCTASHPEWLCSYRRDGPSSTGRLAAAIRRSPRD